MMKKVAKALLTTLTMAFAVSAAAQDPQTTACPGWNNPTNFTAGTNALYYYNGWGGSVNSSKQAPNVMTGFTGINWNGNNGTGSYSTPYSASQLANVAAPGCGGYYCGSGIPEYTKMFYINSDTIGSDPNTDGHLKYVPTQFNTTNQSINTHLKKSIRIGDACSCGSDNDGYGASCLMYNLKVMPENALFFIYYAVVVENPGHGVNGDPSFIIRVTKDPNTLSSKPPLTYGSKLQISDTLAYMVCSTPASNGGTVTPNTNYNQNGWHGAGGGYYGSYNVLFKDWKKVAINLNNYLYENVRIEIMISDCLYNAHWAYAYIAGECRPMKIDVEGCPVGLDTTVAVLSAPRGMDNYVWYASEWGGIEPPNFGTGDGHDYVTWRRLTPTTGPENPYADYRVGPSDFRYTKAFDQQGQVVNVDTIASMQTFRVEMTSALDPAKPFKSYLYANVTNKKPTMSVDSLFSCDGDLWLNNQSFVPGQTDLIVDSTTEWYFFRNTNLRDEALIKQQADSMLIGDSVYYHFDNRDLQGLLVQTNTIDTTCYSQAIYIIQPKVSPKPGMTISERVLCDADMSIVTDTTSDVAYREWHISGSSQSDTLRGYGSDNNTFTRGYQDAVNAIELFTRNDLFLIDTATGDTLWCSAVAHDTISVFLHPELQVLGDTIVCQGSKTDATVNAVGTENCTYQWSLSLGSITGDLPAGNRLRVTPYADTATYFVKVTSPQGCIAWDSIHAYLVSPRLTMWPDDGEVCPGDTAILFGSAADHYTWSASPSDPSLSGQQNRDTIFVTPSRTTTYTMVGHGSNNCNATPLKSKVTVYPVPTPRFSSDVELVDVENPTVVLRDVSPNSVNAVWTFSGNETVTGREVQHTFDGVYGVDSVHFTLRAINAIGCGAQKEFGLPVNLFTAWFPNVFSPGSNDANATFRLFTINHYEFFHIRVYNRFGRLVYESHDPAFQWDGSDNDGNALPQGAYVYICSFRKPGTNSINTVNGTITLVR